MSKKQIPINYTNRDFNSIRQSLVEHAKRYYPNTYKDFNEASFGSLMLDTVAYVGDVLSFYLDYQANETFLDTAAEYKNVLKLTRTLGYKFNKSPSSYGVCQFFVLIPVVTNTGAPDMRYAPILRRGTKVSSDDGGIFTLTEDIDFSNVENKMIVAKVNEDTGAPTYFAIKSEGQIVSGEFLEYTQEVGPFMKFLTVEVPGDNVAEIVSITDAEGHSYYEVEYLSQNTVYKPLLNRNFDKDNVPNILKAVAVPRRYTVEHADNNTFVQFGYGSDSELVSGSIADPSNVVLKRHGREHISDTTLDPTKLTSTDKFGISPSDTTLSIIYRSNTESNVNASSNSVKTITEPKVEFNNLTLLSDSIKDYIASTIEVTNEESIVGDLSLPGVQEVKRRAMDTFATQNRAVTKQDYISMTYAMPGKFGAVKRCTILRDDDEFRRNLNLYVLSENKQNHLVRTNRTIKNNLKNWLNGVRMINDSIDILDAYVINIGIEFEIVIDPTANKFAALRKASLAIESEFKIHKEIGEPIITTDYFKVLKNVEEILDVTKIKVVNKYGLPYSEVVYSIDRNTTLDGRVILAPKNHIFELKFPDIGIKGTIR